MNRQYKIVNGFRIATGIEWCDETWNFIGGCFHDCVWVMPDGDEATCYAGDVAVGVAKKAYPEGFRHHYYRPGKLVEPFNMKKPAKIFVDSMSDMFGEWVPDDQIKAGFDAMKRAYWHTFQALTKNAPKLLKYANDIPSNMWVGVSLPPSKINGHEISGRIQERMFMKSIQVLHALKTLRPDLTTFFSLEPLSFDPVPALTTASWDWGYVPNWLIIGAASKDKKLFQPNPAHVEGVHQFADERGIAVFHKGNLDWNPVRREFPLSTGQLL